MRILSRETQIYLSHGDISKWRHPACSPRGDLWSCLPWGCPPNGDPSQGDPFQGDPHPPLPWAHLQTGTPPSNEDLIQRDPNLLLPWGHPACSPWGDLCSPLQKWWTPLNGTYSRAGGRGDTVYLSRGDASKRGPEWCSHGDISEWGCPSVSPRGSHWPLLQSRDLPCKGTSSRMGTSPHLPIRMSPNGRHPPFPSPKVISPARTLFCPSGLSQGDISKWGSSLYLFVGTPSKGIVYESNMCSPLRGDPL